MNTIIKVTHAQVFEASTKIWQMRLVEQLAVWHVPLFKANLFLYRFKRVDVLINTRVPCWGSVFKMGSH